MPLTLVWQDIAKRLALTLFAGILIGINRTEHGRPAGLRTVMLVCLAASVSMIQVNLLLTVSGKPPGSFVVMDLMRLPLGILSGMGFIGGGVILKRENVVLGVTTAATLWFTTVIGLCLGGGQIYTGLTGLALALIVLWVMKWIEDKMQRDRLAMLNVRAAAPDFSEDELIRLLKAEGYGVISVAVMYGSDGERDYEFSLQWSSLPTDTKPPAFLDSLARRPAISQVLWRPATP